MGLHHCDSDRHDDCTICHAAEGPGTTYPIHDGTVDIAQPTLLFVTECNYLHPGKRWQREVKSELVLVLTLVSGMFLLTTKFVINEAGQVERAKSGL